MVTRIHYRESGVEYVLQYNASTDTIELKKNKYTLIGGIPNYFRDEWGTYVYEMVVFKETLLASRPPSHLSTDQYPLTELTTEEQAVIYEFEEIADINLQLTLESINRHRMALMAEIARATEGLNLRLLVSATIRLADSYSNQLGLWLSENILHFSPDPDRYPPRYANGQLQSTEEPQPTDEPAIPQETPSINTEGLTEEEIQENSEFIQRLLQDETISALDTPSSEKPNSNKASIDDLLREIDETLEEPVSDDETVRAAPAHRFEIPASMLASLWRQANDEDDET